MAVKKSNKNGLLRLRYDVKLNKDGKWDFTPKVVPKNIYGDKALKEHNKLIAIITVNGVEYEADIESINYMSSVLSIANFRYNQAVISGMTQADAWVLVYDQIVTWKDANNVFQSINLNQLADALEEAMRNISAIISV